MMMKTKNIVVAVVLVVVYEQNSKLSQSQNNRSTAGRGLGICQKICTKGKNLEEAVLRLRLNF